MILEDFRDRHKDSRAFIIGKGPSLDRIGDMAVDLNTGVVICVNEAVKKIETLGLDAPIYVVQQDTMSLKDRCVPISPAITHFVNGLVRNRERFSPGRRKWIKAEKLEFCPNAITYDPREVGCDPTTLTAIVALHIAKLMGMRFCTFCCFDAWVQDGSLEYASAIGTQSKDGGAPQRFFSHKEDILQAARELGFSCCARMPEVEVG